MNRRLKKELERAFAPPEPQRKGEFLAAVNFPQTKRRDFIIAQAGFIRKRIWLMSFAAAFMALAALSGDSGGELWKRAWLVSSLLPFLSLAGIGEIIRSASCNMAELEMSCRYSFTQVVLARLGILGGVNLLTLGGILGILCYGGDGRPFSLAVCLFTPYLLSCVLSLFAVNRMPVGEKECLYICGVISSLIGMANYLTAANLERMWTEGYLPARGGSCLLLTGWMAGEIVKLTRNKNVFSTIIGNKA